MRYVLGADVGTTRLKCLLFDESGRLAASATRDYRSIPAPPGRSEQDAREWPRAFVEAAREAIAAAGAEKAVRAICLATQGGTLVPVDAAGRPLHNAIVWNDGRCAKERALLARRVSAEAVWQKTGWRLSSGLNALQILWLRENEPDIFRAAWKFLSVPDYMSLYLTGLCAIDLSNAGINQLADIGKGAWDGDILRALGIGEERLAQIVPSGRVIGPLTASAAAELGLSGDVVLVAGGHDQYMSALGAGALQAGDAMLATGTCWVAAQISAQRPDRHSVSRHVVDGLWGELQSHESGGGALEWFRAQLGPGEGLTYRQIDDFAAQSPPGAGGVRFFPFLTGGGEMRGAFAGLTAGNTRWDLARAVLEGVCFQAAWMLEDFGTAPDGRLTMTGGAAHSPLWSQMVADVTGRAVTVPKCPDTGCVGAAMLSGVAAGVYPSLPEAAARLCGGGPTYAPGAAAQTYAQLSKRYRRECAALEKLYQIQDDR